MKFKELQGSIKSDLILNGGKTFAGKIKIFFYNPSFRLLLNYRLGKYFFEHRFKILRAFSSYYKYRQVTKRNCDISYKAHIELKVKFPHPLGIVIGDGAVIKHDVTIWQNVTLGSHGKKGNVVQYPVIEKGVRIYAGAQVIGGIVIGENAVIGANAVVTINVPKESVAVGVPAKIVVK